jgi:hypothetical protein
MTKSTAAFAWLFLLFLGCSSGGGASPGNQRDADASPSPTDVSSPSDSAALDLGQPQDTGPAADVAAADLAMDAAPDSGAPEVASETSAVDVGSETAIPAGLKVVMITNGTMTAGDKVMSDRLQSRGFVVTKVSDAAVTTSQAMTFDLVLISSSAESAPLGSKVRDVTIPVVSIENGEYGPMRMTGTTRGTDWDMTTGQTTVKITMPTHPLAAGLSGTVTISSMVGELGWGVPAASATIVATMADNPGRAVIFGFTTGAQMVGGTAPARRVGYAIREALAANLTADGLKLFDAAITWALGK